MFTSRSLHQNKQHNGSISNNTTNINQLKSHTYPIAQNNMKSSSNIVHRKRKYIETFDDNNDNNISYLQMQSQYEPPHKQHITEQIACNSIASIRDSCVQTNNMNIELNSIDHNLNALSLTKKGKNKRKRTFTQINENNINELCVGINKKMKIWDPIDNKSYPLHVNNNKNNCNNNNEIKDNKLEQKEEDPFESDLIPKIIQYASLLNNENIFINKLYNNSVSNSNPMNKMKLNKYTGAVVVYKEPKKDWRQLITEYYKNKMNEKSNDNIDNDCDMNDNSNKRRAIRLHPSYTGFNVNVNMNTEQMKKIANKCYVSSVKGNKCDNSEFDGNESNDNCMDCD